jgi:predicted esterase
MIARISRTGEAVRLAGAVLAVLCLVPAAVAAQTEAAPEMRQPWSRNHEAFLKSWLVTGGFEASGGRSALAHDFLRAAGGEAAVRPEAGDTVEGADGRSATWRPLTSWGDEVNLGDSLPDPPGAHLVGYAFATVRRAEAGPARIAIGSDEGIRIWLNGRLVHDLPAARSLFPDEDAVDVEMAAGDNALLVKLEQRRGPWTFTLRVLEPGAVLLRVREIAPVIVEAGDSTLAVRTDARSGRPGQAKVTVTVVGAGGTAWGTQDAARGAVVSFDSAPWPDGPYEVRCLTRRPSGRPFVTHLPWYKGDALAAARELVDEAGSADESTTYGMTLKMLAEMVLDRLGGKLEGGQEVWERIHSPLLEHAELKLAQAGETGPVREYGFVRLAYRDPVDGSPQFCRAYLPGGYDPARKWPLVVQLHGYNGENPRYVRWWSADSRHAAEADEMGVIHIEPHGRGNTQYRGMGEKDVLRAIALAKQRFSVDEDRVYLMGDSMGGWGTWQVGTRHPELFAAIAPIFGGADYRLQMPAEAQARLTDVERFFLEQTSSFAQAEALLTTPILITHGDQDQAVDVEYSRYVVRMLQRWGYDVRYREVPGGGHEDLHARLANVEWFLKQTRQADPRRVRLRAGELKSASAHWLRVERRGDPVRFVAAEAEVLDPNVIRLDTDNAATVTLSPGPALVDPAAPLEVIWNGVSRKARLVDGRVTLGEAAAVGELQKRPELEGPIEDLTARPFVVVVGTVAEDELARELCQRKADAFVDAWEQWQHETPRVQEDTALSEADRARYSLLLIGGPDQNAVSRELVGRIPLQVTSDAIVIDGRRFEAHDAAVQMVYPSPWNPDQYVLVAAGTSGAGLYFWDTVLSDQGVGPFDFVIQDGRCRMGPDPRLGARLRVASGRFDQDWGLERGLVIEGDAGLRAERPLARVPRSDHGFDLDRFQPILGEYRIPQGPRITVLREQDRLMVEVPGQGRTEILPLSEDEFAGAALNVGLDVVRDEKGAVTGLRISQGAREFEATRAAP